MEVVRTVNHIVKRLVMLSSLSQVNVYSTLI